MPLMLARTNPASRRDHPPHTLFTKQAFISSMTTINSSKVNISLRLSLEVRL